MVIFLIFVSDYMYNNAVSDMYSSQVVNLIYRSEIVFVFYVNTPDCVEMLRKSAKF